MTMLNEIYINYLEEIMPKKKDYRYGKEKYERMLKLKAEMSAPFVDIQRILQNITKRARQEAKLNHEVPVQKFDNIYSLLCNESLLTQAYGNIKGNKGRLTPGTNKETVDEISENKIRILALKLKNQEFKFSPVRRKYIPKPKRYKKGEPIKMRPLGVPNFEDRLVQEAIRIILESIYEPYFEKVDCNMGFRPKKSCHHCVRKLKYQGTGLTTAIEGDIKGAYDNVNHDVLILILKKKISDMKFLNLLYQGFKAGILDQGKREDSLLGVPQGGLASPILFNIYMHEFDLFVKGPLNEYVTSYNKLHARSYKPRNPIYEEVQKKLNSTRNKYRRLKRNRKWIELTKPEQYKAKAFVRNLKKLSFTRTNLPSILVENKLLKLVYVRYADDWIILTNAKSKLATIIKERISNWLESNLKLELSPEKTYITNLKVKAARFVGFSFKTYLKRRLSKNKMGEFTKTAGWNMIVDIDVQRILDRLVIKKFCNDKYKPIAKNPWSVLKLEDIVNKYNYMMRGIGNYYFPVVDRLTQLNRIFYILKFSCLGTFAKKLSLKITKITKKFGDPISFTVKGVQTNRRTGKVIETQKRFTLLNYNKVKEICRYTRFDWKNNRFATTVDSDIFKPMENINWRSRRNLTNVCVICGTDKDVQMHHIKHIRKGKVIGFSQIMKQLNRTAIPVCRIHHQEIHNGKYSDIKLSDLYGLERFLL